MGNQKIKRLRLRAKLSQAELARRSGIGQGLLSHYEAGYRMPKVPNLRKLAAALNVPLADLL
jgi:transcriptional regulator with XRE-family HTH domain